MKNCITFEWYRDRVYHLDESHNPQERMEAFGKSLEWGDEIPTGVFCRHSRPVITDKIPPLRDEPMLKQTFDQQKALALVEDFY